MVSDVALAIGVLSPVLMPRVYYSDPTATVGWKGRWHFSMLAPAATMVSLTFLIDGPIKQAAKDPRPGCEQANTDVGFPGSGCETFGAPSTHMFATYGSFGAGATIFLVDTFKYSDGRFNVPSFIGNVALPLTAAVLGTVGRAIETGTDATTGVTIRSSGPISSSVTARVMPSSMAWRRITMMCPRKVRGEFSSAPPMPSARRVPERGRRA